jgi:hypothetical protein
MGSIFAVIVDRPFQGGNINVKDRVIFVAGVANTPMAVGQSFHGFSLLFAKLLIVFQPIFQLYVWDIDKVASIIGNNYILARCLRLGLRPTRDSSNQSV